MNLDEGWNMISMNLTPQSRDIQSVMNPVADKLVIVKDSEGQSYIPQYQINQIGDVDFKEGYQVYMSDAAQLEVKGQAVDPTTPIALSEGWCMIGYLPDVPIDIADALASISGQLVIAKNNGGQSYLPAYNINQIGDMLPGQGYQIYLNNSGTLIYPAAYTLQLARLNGKKNQQCDSTFSRCAHFECVGNSGNNAVLIIPLEIKPSCSNGELLSTGDEIGVFTPSDQCCGAGIWEDENMAITLWGCDSLSNTDGFSSGDSLALRVWRKNESAEYFARFKYQPDDAGIYEKDALLVLEKLSVDLSLKYFSEASDLSLPTDFKIHQNYPNPFNPETAIRYQLPENSDISIRVYSLLGERVKTLVAQNQPAGYYSVTWDGKNDASNHVASGIYMYRILATSKHGNDFTETKKNAARALISLFADQYICIQTCRG